MKVSPFLWVAIILLVLVAAIGGGYYVFYSPQTQSKPKVTDSDRVHIIPVTQDPKEKSNVTRKFSG